MATPAYSIKTMTRADLAIAVAWAAAEGWNPGLYDVDCFYAADPTGFLMGWLDDQPIASISVVKYGNTFGFLGFYIVQPKFRGQGYGLQLWQAGLAYLANRTIGLDGVVAQQANYVKSGFQLAYRNVRYQGMGDRDQSKPADAQSTIVPLNSLPINTVIAYDQPFFPDDRTRFLTHWLTQPNSHAIGLMRQQTLAGYGVIRPCRDGHKIGPLFADIPEFAEALFLALKAQVPVGQPFYLDTPAVNPAAIALAQQYQMQPIFETARMYNDTPPKLPLTKIFGVTSFELG